MNIVSFDPGKEGSFAIINDELSLLECHDFEYKKVGKNWIINAAKILDVIKPYNVEKVIIEQVGFVRGQGGTSSFSFGSRFGELCTIASILDCEIDFVTPMKWKRGVGLIGTAKKQSAVKAASVYPQHKELFVQKNKRCKDGNKYFDGRGDAVMIGLYYLKTLKNSC